MQRLFGAFILVIATIACPLVAAEATTRPSGPVTYRHEVRQNPPLHLHIVTVDLTDPAVRIKVCRGSGDAKLPRGWETSLATVSDMTKRDGLSVAVNGNFFMPKDSQWILGRLVPYFDGNLARVCGWAMNDGVAFSATPADVDWPALVVFGHRRVAIGQFVRLPPGAQQAVSGQWQIVTDGQNVVPPGNEDDRAPRTAVGLDKDAKTLILLVVDGRRPLYSAGITLHQLGQEMLGLGAYQAINLDGGGSSTLVLRNAGGQPQVVNWPSDGHDFPMDVSIERCVANALGIVIDAPSTQPAHP
ncbi:MAG: phosphodiester glycosidase family protein [Tepidisphaeraceae bacterium]|jgi:hypothetical protein